MFLLCHAISKNQVIPWSFDFLGKRHSSLITILPSFMARDIVLGEI